LVPPFGYEPWLFLTSHSWFTVGNPVFVFFFFCLGLSPFPKPPLNSTPAFSVTLCCFSSWLAPGTLHMPWSPIFHWQRMSQPRDPTIPGRFALVSLSYLHEEIIFFDGMVLRESLYSEFVFFFPLKFAFSSVFAFPPSFPDALAVFHPPFLAFSPTPAFLLSLRWTL